MIERLVMGDEGPAQDRAKVSNDAEGSHRKASRTAVLKRKPRTSFLKSLVDTKQQALHLGGLLERGQMRYPSTFPCPLLPFCFG